MYKLQLTGGGITRISDNAGIPPNDQNTDWQKYQKWLAEGNTPEPAETTAEKKMRLKQVLRAERNARLDAIDKNDIPVDIWDDMSVTQKTKYKVKKQKLRDMPANHNTIADLENPTWPTL